ncbi:DUF2087 domain-containing protein [Amycolatopsis sp. FDAARGOS 1241]|uniref:DUF2087 domain-containing protein n=1 Tax=Amycolatopsis sp. FDAARGOS 1241 TaxID=2778070 RepID=UPI00195017AC|nr:DUF2087 domain-containing protein [Amycolatopsis sp. FDAARGOS 1241]QRP47526.1 DUF2087 domain-containing protein [Amycolatopsis sp. FDAARGOS 1241]
MPSPEALVSALADPERLRFFVQVCSAPDGLPAPADRRTRKLAQRLAAAGLITLDAGRCRAVPEVFAKALTRPPADPVEALFTKGRLVALPRPGKVRQALLARLADGFEPGRVYTEREVRAKLGAVHDDHAALRRYLVDEGFLERSNDGSAYGRPSA